MATITKRASSYIVDATGWNNIQNAYDASTSTYMSHTSTASNASAICLLFDYPEIPNDIEVTAVTVNVVCSVRGRLSYRLVKDAVGAINHFNISSGVIISEDDTTVKSGTFTNRFTPIDDGFNDIVENLNLEPGLLHDSRLGIRLYNPITTTAYSNYIYDVTITIEYTETGIYSIGKRPYTTKQASTYWTNVANLYDTNPLTASTFSYTGSAQIAAIYNFTSIPANAIIEKINTIIRYSVKGKISYRVVSDPNSQGNTTGSGSILAGGFVILDDTTTTTSATYIDSFSSSESPCTNINSDLSILRTEGRFALRFVGDRKSSSSNSVSIYDIPVIIFYTIPQTIYTSVSSSGGGTTSGGGTYRSGDTITISATPAAGYHFVQWDDGDNNATRNILLTSLNNNKTYTAFFSPNTYTVTFNPCGGSVSSSSKTVTYDNTYGTLPTPTRTGYDFAGWYSVQPVYNGGFLRNNDFVALGRTYMYTDKINVKVFAYMDNWSNLGDKQLISCTQSGGWGIGGYASSGTEAYIDGVGYKSVNFDFPSQSNNYQSSLTSGWHCFDMVFNGSTLYGYVDGTLKGSTSAGGSIQYNAYNGIFIGAEADNSTTDPEAGYYFNGSLGSVFIAHQGTRLEEIISSTTVTTTTNHTLYAAWRINHYTTSTTSINGLVNGLTLYSTTNPYGEQITLTATPNTGYEFTKWSDNSTTNPKTLTVTSNNSYVANFAFINKIYSGTTKLSGIYIGTTPVKAVYIGTTKIYDST